MINYKFKSFKRKLNKKLTNNLLIYIFKKKNNFLISKKKKIAIYGMGSLGQDAMEYLKFHSEYKLKLIDKYKKFFKKEEVLHPDRVNKNFKKNYTLMVCIVNFPFKKIYNNLKKKKWREIFHFYDYINFQKIKHPLDNGWFIGELSKIEQNKISNIANDFWSDLYSLKHYIQFLAWKKCREEWLFMNSKIDNDNRFFINQIINNLSTKETFIDVGAHKCSVSKKFIDHTNNKFNKIFLIEPDNENFFDIKKFINKNSKNKKKIFLIKKVISNNISKQKFFNGLNYSSQLSKFGNKTFKTTTIDNLNLKPTFIKFHIEGNELKALKGSLNTIKKYRPKLVLTAYHNSDIVYKIPLWLKKNLMNYKFYFRLHSWCGSGAVIYCVPNK